MSNKGKRGRSRAVVKRALEEPAKATYDDWVWWPNDPSRRSRAAEEFKALPSRVQGEMLDRIKRFLEGETRYKDVDDLGDGIKELRYRSGNNHFRVLFFVSGRVCVALTCFYKNQRKTEKADLDRARSRKSGYRG